MCGAQRYYLPNQLLIVSYAPVIKNCKYMIHEEIANLMKL